MISFITFSLCCYAVCFLAADAKIFGCSTTAYLEDPNDSEYIESAGVFRIRQHLLKIKFFRELFSCYFCMGVWAGPLVHLLLVAHCHVNPGWRYSYFLGGVDATLIGASISVVAASLLGATVSYFLNLVIAKLESDGHP